MYTTRQPYSLTVALLVIRKNHYSISIALSFSFFVWVNKSHLSCASLFTLTHLTLSISKMMTTSSANRSPYNLLSHTHTIQRRLYPRQMKEVQLPVNIRIYQLTSNTMWTITPLKLTHTPAFMKASE